MKKRQIYSTLNAYIHVASTTHCNQVTINLAQNSNKTVNIPYRFHAILLIMKCATNQCTTIVLLLVIIIILYFMYLFIPQPPC